MQGRRKEEESSALREKRVCGDAGDGGFEDRCRDAGDGIGRDAGKDGCSDVGKDSCSDIGDGECDGAGRDLGDDEDAHEDAYEDRKDLEIEEEFRIWRKNVPYLYDMFLSHVLAWPSLTVEWFPDAIRNEESETTTQRVLLGTHTAGQEEEYLQIVGITLPDTVCDASLKSREDGGYGFGESKVKVLQKIPVKKEINRARCMRGNSSIIAVRTDLPEVAIYDYTKHASFPKEAAPNMVLEGHTAGGYGLLWHPVKDGVLTTSGYDGLICTFDVASGPTPAGVIKEKEEINDISLSVFGEMLAVGTEKAGTIIIDKRDGSRKVLDSGETLCSQFSLDSPNVLATGSKDGSARVWDLRNERAPIHVLSVHKDEVVQVQWSPHFEHVLATAGRDRRVNVWDLSKAGEAQTEEEKEEGPPELLFVHGGHIDALADICWNPHEPWEIASVGDDNTLQVWQLSAGVAPDPEEASDEKNGQ